MAGSGLALWSEDPGKRAAERAYAIYTPVWGGVCGAVMLSGAAGRWGDGALLALGVGLWIGLLVLGFALRAPEDRDKPFHRLYHVKLCAFMAAFAFFGNYFGTRYFYEILDMHYGFRASWNLNDVPVFLYFLTAVYFTTYSVLLNVLVRTVGSVAARLPGARVAALVAASLLVAGLETALNANPFMKSTFCYGDLRFALWFGTLMYGAHFVIAGPLWHRIDERRGSDTPMREVLGGVLAASALVMCADEAVKHLIAPRFTTVVEGRVGIPGKQGPSCLAGD
jgi:cycloeucalenol cycloisomerase